MSPYVDGAELPAAMRSHMGRLYSTIAVALLVFPTLAQESVKTRDCDGPVPGITSIKQGYVRRVSPDGDFVVGETWKGQAFLWDRTDGMQILNPPTVSESEATAVSSGASAVVGRAHIGRSGGFRWTKTNGFHPLVLDERLQPTNITSDGRIVVGFTKSKGFRTFIWSQQDGLVFPNLDRTLGAKHSALAVSDDGNVIIGWSPLGDYIWKKGQPPLLVKTLAPGLRRIRLWDVSGDGTVVIGTGNKDGDRAFVWSDEFGLHTIEPLKQGQETRATAVSGNGKCVVGFSGEKRKVPGTWEWAERSAFIWTREKGLRLLTDVVSDLYFTQNIGWSFHTAQDISADCKTLIGDGTDSCGEYGAWYLTLPVVYK